MTQLFSPSPAFATAAGGDVSIADVAEGVVPSVVNISATRVVESRAMNPMFREFFGDRAPMTPRGGEAQSLGSGVIVGADGLILTNNHVVEDARDVIVTLRDGREFDAKVLGTDPKSDLAVIRLEGDASGLEPLPMGSSSAMRLGDVVLAVGNPFGVGQSVSMGIVSATGRSSVGIVDYENFIQTDAAINPGNSGGALVNMRGELIGINTAIASRSGGYQGVGFAIPTDMVRPIMDSLIKNGKVSRGWLGIAIQTIDRDLAAALDLSSARGVLVSDVQDDSPAARAGLERGDVITSVGDHEVTTSAQLRNRIAGHQPGDTVELAVVRNGSEKKLAAKLGALASSPAERIAVEAKEGALAGVHVATITPQIRSRLDLPEDVDGVVVTTVEPSSPAARAGLRRGDVILEANRKKIDSVEALSRLEAKSGDAVALLVYRNGSTVYLALRK